MLNDWNSADAASLEERLAGLVEPSSVAASRLVAGDRMLSHWRDLVAAGREDEWDRRVSKLGLSPATLESLLGPVTALRPGIPWEDAVGALLDDAASVVDTTASGQAFGLSTDRIPFGDLLVPLATVGARRVRAEMGELNHVFSEHAWAQLELQLLRRLAEASEPTLTLEFSVFRSKQRGPLERLLALSTTPGSDALYQAFVNTPKGDRLTDVVHKYPALARAWSQLVEDWIEVTSELVRHLDADGDALCEILGLSGPLPVVESIRADLSDRHHGGRTVARLQFEGGTEVIYKPRNIDIEARWSELLRWCSERDAPEKLVGLQVLTRPTHGWVEVARAQGCASADEFPAFYRRAGALLCLVYSLAGNDCHRENLIAVGEHPVLVDMETMMHPGMGTAPDTDDDAHAVLARRLHHSVLCTAMLPHWSPMPTGGGYESGGIGPGGAVATSVQGLLRHASNTDEASLIEKAVTLPAADNVPHVQGCYASADEHREEIVAGFEAMARFIARSRTELLAEDGPIEAFRGVKIRVLLRGTPAYDSIRGRSMRASAMRSGAARSIEIDYLSRPLLLPETDEAAQRAAWTMVDDERRSLERLDIPRFEVPVEGSAVAWRAHWDRSGLSLCRQRIAELDEDEIARQVHLIRASFEARTLVDAVGPVAAPRVHPDRIAPDAEVRRTVENVVTRIEQLATQGAGETATWMTTDVIEASRAYKLRPMGASLYGGTAGVGLFLAAASAVVGDERAKRLAYGAVASVRAAIQNQVPAGSAIGGVMGSSSTAYALAWMGSLLGDDSLVQDATTSLLRIDDHAIEADRHFDMAGGSAGAILVLLAVNRMRPNEALIERAVRCGEHLLSHRTGEPATWETPNGSRLAGLAHGASGIALALNELSQVSGGSNFAAAGNEGLEHERTLFHAHAGNWEDVRPDVPGPGPSFMNSWCNGACGIGMARLRQTGMVRQREELAVALQTATQHGLGGLDHLCCGNLGRAELLLEAGHRQGDRVAVLQSRRIFTGMMDRATERGHWALAHRMHAASEHAGLFRGLAGIGWHGLRQLDPQRLPCLGTLDGPRG